METPDPKNFRLIDREDQEFSSDEDDSYDSELEASDRY